jgi:hypothetical protein
MTPPVSPSDVTGQTWLRVFRVALRGLRDLYDPASGLMARYGEHVAVGWQLHTPSPRNTAMVLGALHRLEGLGIAHGLDARALERALDGLAGEMSVADTSLDLWSDALGEGRRAPRLWARLGGRLGAADLESLELAWALTALTHFIPLATDSDAVGKAASALANRLLERQHPGSGLFRASTRRQGWLRKQKPDAALASQIYPVYALVKFGEAFDRKDALDAARACGHAIVASQGPLGQWWWKYDVASRRVLDGGYPIYPVNQDAAVPLALLSLARHGEPGFWLDAVARGLAWECGANEVQQPLIDDERGCIARSVERDGAGWRVSWHWFSYHPARAIMALAEVGDLAGLPGADLQAMVLAEAKQHGA